MLSLCSKRDVKISKTTTSRKEKSISCLIFKAVFNYPPHWDQHGKIISGQRKERREGLSLYLWCGKWPKTENPHLQFSCIVLLTCSVMRCKNSLHNHIIRVFFLKCKRSSEASQHKEKSGPEYGFDILKFGLLSLLYLYPPSLPRSASLTSVTSAPGWNFTHCTGTTQDFCCSKSGTELGISPPLFPEVQVIQ